MPAAPQPHPANRLLAALPPKAYRRMLGGLERVSLEFGHVLYEPGDAVRHVYFPNDCLVSLLVVLERSAGLEVGMIGKEGVVGISLALGNPRSPVRALVQRGGTAMQMSAERFARELERDRSLQRSIDRCIHVVMTTAMQIAACNKSHVLESRLARRLLMVRDRLGGDEFRLTQEFLALMLGVRREAVTGAASALQRRKLIRYSRGTITILHAKRLRATSCRCYEVIRKLESGAR